MCGYSILYGIMKILRFLSAKQQIVVFCICDSHLYSMPELIYSFINSFVHSYRFVYYTLDKGCIYIGQTLAEHCKNRPNKL